MSWKPEFFRWLRHELIVVEDWPYAGTDFIGDPNLPLPEGDHWDEELGKTSCFLIFMFYVFLLIHIRPNTFYICMQMWALRDQPVCLQSCGGLFSPLILRQRAQEGRS